MFQGEICERRNNKKQGTNQSQENGNRFCMFSWKLFFFFFSVLTKQYGGIPWCFRPPSWTASPCEENISEGFFLLLFHFSSSNLHGTYYNGSLEFFFPSWPSCTQGSIWPGHNGECQLLRLLRLYSTYFIFILVCENPILIIFLHSNISFRWIGGDSIIT